ncbi:hypothetical protein LG047_01615 [Methylocystis sp. WRRC1]|uniref:hypothetical protein n=1 Tax=unclassified Methylocystis TaxID=2625913 RepID=UPI0001F86C92|nr:MULTISPECIES: hypothetical protein [unclassified Methylocystis]MCC3244026.1 hypothetical protein [Methylocystis sp. WRRC1]
MSKFMKSALLAALTGGFLFAATSASSAGPLSVANPQDEGLSSSLIQKVAHYNPPGGKKCLKWTRRFNPSHGFGHRRCVHWK